MPYERRGEPVLPRREFAGRLARSLSLATALIFGSLALGTLGYHAIAALGWVDSIHNATMVLTGMGPVDRMPDDAAKLFASAYALFSGVVFLTSIGVVLAPIGHRLLHRFHADPDGPEADGDR